MSNLFQFNQNFLWGAASAAYQIEGGYNADGKGPSIWDSFSKIPGKTKNKTNGDIAIDHYHRFHEDVELMAKMGLKAYRFSISWSRILPNGEGEINEAGLDFYRRLIADLKSHQIEPLVTLYHWDMPQALQDKYGGWESRETILAFLNYCRIVFKEFGSQVKYWITFNEQNVFTALGYRWASHPPNMKNIKLMYQVNHIVNLANSEAIKLFHEMVPTGQIGPSFGYGEVYPATSDPADVLAAVNANQFNNDWWLDVYCRGEYPPKIMKTLAEIGIAPEITAEDTAILKQGKPDFLGINYYHGGTVEAPEKAANNQKRFNQTDPYLMAADEKQGLSPEKLLFHSVENQHLAKTSFGWEVDPIGFRISLRQVYEKYQLPIIVTENGLGATDKLTEDNQIHDQYRIDYLKEHLLSLAGAIQDGVPVLGYCAWSFTDLLSWLNGYDKRYGFVYVDRTDQDQKNLTRYPKDSYFWYQQVISSQGRYLMDKA